jgi:hypothetical protein
VSNIGFGEDATHTKGNALRVYTPDVRNAKVWLEWQEPEEDKVAFLAYCQADFLATGGYFTFCKEWLDENCHAVYALLRNLCRLPTWPWRKIQKLRQTKMV